MIITPSGWKARRSTTGSTVCPRLPRSRTWCFGDNKAFKNRETGYFKHSSGVNNTPLTYRAHNRWPAKFGVVGDLIAKYPKSKIFIYSRHKAQGANAIGLFLENELGWDRMSNNRQDHGTNAPRYFNPLAKELGQIILGKSEESESKAKLNNQSSHQTARQEALQGFHRPQQRHESERIKEESEALQRPAQQGRECMQGLHRR